MSSDTLHFGKEKRTMDKKPIFDPTISWGDVLMAVVLTISGVMAVASLQEELSVHETKISHNDQAIENVSTELKNHKVESLQADNVLRNELKTELRDINAKLDRLIDRELDRTN